MLGRLIFNSHFKYIDENELLNPNQSSLSSIWFLCKPTAFYKPWSFFKLWLWPTKGYRFQYSQIYLKHLTKFGYLVWYLKLNIFGISGDLLELIKNFLANRFQRVVRRELNNNLDKFSDWVCTWKMSFNPDPSKQAQWMIF